MHSGVSSGLVRPAVLFAIVMATPAYGLDPELAITQYVQSVWRAPQALPHDDVTSVVQTRDGYLWVGTVEGLARFDGVRSVVFDKNNTPAIFNNWVKALVEDRSGRLWVGTYGGGLVCREGGRFVRYDASRGLPQDIVTALYEDHMGRVWAGTHSAGFFRFQGGRFIREPGTEATSRSTVRALLQDRDGTLWIGAEDGLYRFAGGVTTRLTRENGLTDDSILSLAEDREGLWIGTEKGGLNRLARGRFSAIGTKDGLSHDRVWSLALDRDENLWIGTDGGGLDRLSRGRLTSFTTKNGLTNDYVWAIHEDREGSLWIATNGGGLNRLKNGRVVSLTSREGLPSDFIWSVLRAHDGSLFIGTEDAGLVRFQKGRVTQLTVPNGFPSNVKALAETRDGSLWIGGMRGLYRWTGGAARPTRVPDLSRDTVSAIAEDGDRALWIGTNSGGLKRLNRGPLQVTTMAQGLSSDSVTSLLVARDGSLWIGTLGGLDHLAEGRLAAFTNIDGLPSNYVTSVFEGPDAAIWAGTRGGLARIRDGQVAALTSRQGLFDDAIMSALLGDDGGVWMGGNRGLSRASLRELEDVIARRRPAVAAMALGLEDGMRSVEVNATGSSRWKDADGRLWFATRGGVASVDPTRLVPNRIVPPVAIEEVLADGRALEGAGPWRLPAGTRRLELHFTALSLLSPGSVRLRRRLDGFDPDWTDAGPDRTAHYTNLSHGRYRFRVIAANNDGVWNETGASLEFEIDPRFHERLSFRALVVLFFALAGPLFYVVRVRRLRRQKAALEGLVAARTMEVEAASARLAQLAREDGLTGVANRRRLDEALDEEWRRAHRQRTWLSLLFIDVDCFKAYNDHLGHQAGDACLKAVAQAVAHAHQRAGELVARYGGEEFAVLLPGVPLDEAREEAENLRRRVFELALPHPASTVAPVVTVSVGVAAAEPRAGGSPADLVGAADRALYDAKEGGRNRVGGSGSDPLGSRSPAGA